MKKDRQDNEIFLKLREIIQVHKKINSDFFYEYYPDLFLQIIKKYGSFYSALDEAEIDKNAHFHFDIHCTFYGNYHLIKLVAEIVEKMGNHLKNHMILIKSYEAKEFDPICIDDHHEYYIIKRLAWTPLTQHLIKKIRESYDKPIRIVYCKRENELPAIDWLLFTRIDEYLEIPMIANDLTLKQKIKAEFNANNNVMTFNI